GREPTIEPPQRATCAKRVMPEKIMAQRPLAAVVSPLGAFDEKAPREHRIRVRSQRSERLQFPALNPIKELEGANRRAANLVPSHRWDREGKEPIPICQLAKGREKTAPAEGRPPPVV